MNSSTKAKRRKHARVRSGAAGPPRVLASRGKTTLLATFVLFLINLDLTWAAGGFAWAWGAAGQTCTAACASVGLTCVDKFSKVNTQSALQTASDGSVSCGSFAAYPEAWAPAKCTGSDCTGSYSNQCFWQSNSGTCNAGPGSRTRLCSCTCGAGTYSTSDLKPYPCTRCDSMQLLQPCSAGQLF